MSGNCDVTYRVCTGGHVGGRGGGQHELRRRWEHLLNPHSRAHVNPATPQAGCIRCFRRITTVAHYSFPSTPTTPSSHPTPALGPQSPSPSQIRSPRPSLPAENVPRALLHGRWHTPILRRRRPPRICRRGARRGTKDGGAWEAQSSSVEITTATGSGWDVPGSSASTPPPREPSDGRTTGGSSRRSPPFRTSSASRPVRFSSSLSLFAGSLGPSAQTVPASGCSPARAPG